MRPALRAIFACLLGLAAALLVACGGSTSGYLASDQASSLNGRLDSISSALAGGNCGGAKAAAARLQADVAALPPNVSPTLRSNMAQGADTIAQLTPRSCTHASGSTTTTQATTTATTAPTTPTVAPPPTQATTQSTPAPTTPTTPATTPTSTGTTGGTGTGSGGAGLGGSGTGTSSGGTGTGGGSGNGNGG